jgi:hypothetical protein
MTETTAPDAALLWARERLALQWDGVKNDELAYEYRSGNIDKHCEELRDLVAGYRAGQAHAAGLVEALEAVTEALEQASRSLTDAHKIALGGKRWGGKDIERARAAIAAAKGA